MSSLHELAGEYLEAAARLRMALHEAESRLDTLPPDRRLVMERDIALMQQMLQQTREVGDLARHYYDRGYWRNRKYVF